MALPLAAQALISILGPQALAAIFGGGGQEEQLRKLIAELFLPGNLAKRTDDLQAEWYKSPSYGAAQAASLAAGRMAEASVGRAGAGVTSGMDILRGAAAAGLGTATLAKFNADAYAQSRELAQRQAEALASAYLGVGKSPNLSREMLGASLNFLGPLLFRRLGITTPSGGRTTSPDRWSE